KILIFRIRSEREARDQDTGPPFRDEPSCNSPGRRISAIREITRPGTAHVREGDAMPGPAGMRPQIRNVVAVDLIAAKDAGIDFDGQSLVALLDSAAGRAAELQRLQA